MATKWSELRERVPSTSDLLELPPLRALSERLNRSVVAAGVRSFLHELKTDVERRRTEAKFPSLTELAARAAKHVARLQQPSQRPGINATGQLLDPAWIGRPLADGALQQMVAFGHGYVADLPVSDATNGAARAACRATGAEAATVVHSYSGAIWLALAALATGKEVLVARAEVGEVDPGCGLADVAASAGVKLREVGSVNRTTAGDFEAATSELAAAILKHRPDGYQIVGGGDATELESLIAAARDGEMMLIDTMGSAPLVDDLPGLPSGLPSAAASLAAGANLVIVRGDGLVGGPPCGILLGTRDAIRRIEQHPMYSAWRATAPTSAAMLATLELYDDLQQAPLTIPLVQLLTTSVENLRHRAERLAPQLAQAADIATAEAVPSESGLGVACSGGSASQANAAIASYAVALTPASGDVDSLDTRLRNGVTPIVGRRDGGRLLLDLRTVFPRDDQRLVQLVVGHDAGGGVSPVNIDESSQPVGGA